jgi:hypothetical protein
MSLSFIDIPRFVPSEAYHQAIEKMVSRLKDTRGVISVYQVGGTSTPGISDIDLFVVFEEGIKITENPLRDLPATDQYLFTHNLFGVSESAVSKIEQYTFFGKYNLLLGKELNPLAVTIDSSKEKIIKRQLALEYLMKAFITSTLEHAYHTIKLRNLFLHAKALLIDLSFLGIEKGRLKDAVQEIIDVRNRWFENPVSQKNLNNLVYRYHTSLRDQLQELLSQVKFYLHPASNLQISKNILLKPSGRFMAVQQGILFPKSVVALHHKIPKLLNRMNKFVFYLPAEQQGLPPVITERHRFISSLVKYKESHLGHFIPTAYGLNIFGK